MLARDRIIKNDNRNFMGHSPSGEIYGSGEPELHKKLPLPPVVE
jgi:hypothetical protein